MKTFIFISICLLSFYTVQAQNGVYQSSRFEFISENDPSKNRVEYSNKTLIIQINELQGEFINGKILWELTSGGQSEYLEWELTSLNNSFFDEKTNSFVKRYNSNMKALGIVIQPAEVYIVKFIKDNTYRIDIYDPKLKVINRFDNLTKK